MVKGYKTINIKEELIDRIRNLDENKKEVEEGRFNLAGFFANAALEHINRKPIGLTNEKYKDIVPTVFHKEGVVGLSDKDVKRIAAEMLLEIGMHIETGVAKGVKDLR